MQFFQEHGFIAFEEIAVVDGALDACASHTSFDALHNLFHTSSRMEKLSTSRRCAHIARDLLNMKTPHLRLLFDQAFLDRCPPPPPLQIPVKLSLLSPFQGLCLLLLIRIGSSLPDGALEEQKTTLPTEVIPLSSLPKKSGDALFFHPDQEIQLFHPSCALGDFLLIGYGALRTLYRKNTKSLFPNHLMSKYQPGDLVGQEDCPLLF